MGISFDQARGLRPGEEEEPKKGLSFAEAKGVAPAAPSGDSAGFGEALARGGYESIARTEDQLGTLAGLVGWEGGEEHLRGRAEEMRRLAEEQGEIEGPAGYAGYLAGNLPIELAKFAGVTAATGGAGHALKLGRLVPAAYRQLAGRVAPWMAAGGALRATEPDATPASVAAHAATAGIGPGLQRFGRPVRALAEGAGFGGVGAVEGVEGKDLLAQAVLGGGLGALPSTIKPRARAKAAAL